MVTTICILLLFSGYIRAEEYVHHPVQYQSITDRGTYNFGYDTGLYGAHSLRRENKDEHGIVRGKYAYTDPNGKLRTVVYEAGPFGFRAKGDVGPDGYPQRELPVDSGDSYINDTGMQLSLQSEGTHHIEYNLRPPPGVREQYAPAASSHPNRESKGYVYDPASHPSIENRVYVPQASSHPNQETKGYTYDPATHPDVRDRTYVPESSSHPRQRVKPPVSNPPPRIPQASTHPRRETKGYTYDPATHPDVRDRTYVPESSSQPRQKLQPPVPDPPPRIPQASSHPRRETKGYTYDPATHPDIRDRTYVPESSSQPRQKVKPPIPDLPPRIPQASSHPRRETKGYTYDPATHPDVKDRTYVPESSSQPRQKLQPPVPAPAPRIPQASSHPNRGTKGYTYDPATHPNVQGRIYVPEASIPRPSIHVSPSHPNQHTKAYVHDSSSHSRVHIPAKPAPPSPPSHPAPPPRSPGYSKGYTPSRSEIIAVSRTSSVSVSSSSNRPVYTKGYVTGSRPQASAHRHVHRPSAQASVARTVSRPTYTKGYITGSGSSRSVSRTMSSASERVPHTHSRDYMKSSGSSRSVVKTTGFRQSSYVPQYMSVEEYLRRYRGGKDSRPQS